MGIGALKRMRTEAGGLVIDKEELSWLRKLKDLKRGHRENFDKLNQTKFVIADGLQSIGAAKQDRSRL